MEDAFAGPTPAPSGVAAEPADRRPDRPEAGPPGPDGPARPAGAADGGRIGCAETCLAVGGELDRLHHALRRLEVVLAEEIGDIAARGRVRTALQDLDRLAQVAADLAGILGIAGAADGEAVERAVLARRVRLAAVARLVDAGAAAPAHAEVHAVPPGGDICWL